MKKIIIGPSHVCRLKEQIEHKVFTLKNFTANDLDGIPGIPIWSKKNLDKILNNYQNQNIAILVGDFRFGNSVCLDTINKNSIFSDGYVAIDPRALSASNDELMFDKCLKAIYALNDQFSKRVQFVFWDLLCWQVQDRLANKFKNQGFYQHPIWNLQDVENKLEGVNIVKLSSLLKMPMHEIVRLFIDSSSHPSAIGYHFLDKVLGEDIEVSVAYQEAVNIIMQSLGKKAKQISNKYDGTVVLTGKSIWLDTFVRYLGSNGASQLSQQGLIIAPLNRIQGHPTNQYWKENISGLSQSKVIVIGEGSQLEISNELGISSIEDIVRISWDLDTRDIIIARNEKPKYIYGLAAMQLVKNMANVDVSLTEAMVEFGSFGHPTWLGLQVVLDTIISEVDDELVLKKNKQIFSTENGVLVAKDKMAFLIEGNHSILKYLTGELSPSKASIDSFEHNVINRHNFCSERGIIYKHIIFPDKHTIFEKDFPIYPMNILGKLYLRQLSLEARNLIIYPIESLSREKNISCLKYDTHLSDKGSLIVLKDILRNVDLVHIPTLRKIENSINKSIIRAGDLGSKLSHKPTEEVFILQPSWRIQSFTSPGGFNDGMIDILFSPDSYTDKTLLLFGDSFFRMMLPHFSAFFRKVICLRTRFFHKEMVELIQPDYVFSGNVERYLSQVASDTESHPFFLYPQIKNNQAKMDDIFLSALLAVTSPGSSFARNYVAP